MKILILTNLYPPNHIGGYELICQTVVEGLAKRGHELMILTSNHQVGRETGALTARSQSEGEKEGMRDSDSAAVSVERSLRINGLYGHPWLGLWRLAQLERHNNSVLRSSLERYRPDLIYVWNMGGLSKSMLFTLQASGVPAVFYISDHWLVRGLAADVWLRWWNHPHDSAIRRAIRDACVLTGVRRRWQAIAPTNPIQQLRFPRIYFCSRALRDWSAQSGIPVQHGAIIYCPVHPRYLQSAFVEPRGKLSRLLYAGRLAEDKGVMTALRALALVKGRLDVQLTVCGRGDAEYVRSLKEFAAKNQLAVHFTTAALENMPQIYQQHDALLFTSEWAEPFALTPLEAMACSLPVIGTTTGGSAELFRSGENGLTFTAGNASELADQIVQFAENHSLRSRCARTGYHEARQLYASDVIVQQIEIYLEETLRVWQHSARPVGAAPVPCAS
jgi:glycosyltransferase involved in cell wall biosynthesis